MLPAFCAARESEQGGTPRQHPAPGAVLGSCTLPSHTPVRAAGASSCQGTVGAAPCFAGTCCFPAKQDPSFLWVQEVPCNTPFCAKGTRVPRTEAWPLSILQGDPQARGSFQGRHSSSHSPRQGPIALHPFQGTRRVSQGSAFSPGRHSPGHLPSGQVGRESVTPRRG